MAIETIHQTTAPGIAAIVSPELWFPVSSVSTVEADEEGYTREQFEQALKLASKPIANRAKKAIGNGTIGKAAAKKMMDAALDAGS